MTDAGREQVPVGKLLGQDPQRHSARHSRLSKLVAWRDWKLPLKLAAVTLVPLLIAVALGLSAFSSAQSNAAGLERAASGMTLSSAIGPLLDAVQRERTATTAELSGGPRGDLDLDDIRSAVDDAATTISEAADGAAALSPVLTEVSTGASDALAGLEDLRAEVADGNLDAVEAVRGYSEITEALLGLDFAAIAVATGVGSDALGATPHTLREIRVVREAVSVQQAMVGHGVTRGSLTPSELSLVRNSEVRAADRRAAFDAFATPAQRDLYASAVDEPNATTMERLVSAVLGELGAPSELAIAQLASNEWQDSSSRVFDELGLVADSLGAQASATSNSLASDARTSATVLAIALLLGLALALVIALVIARHLGRSLRELRDTARAVADERLPAAVSAIAHGRGTDAEIDPVPVYSRDEIGEVARAFDAVHGQALRLAVEQAGMRNAYSSVFVNLSRRSQSLVQRQLHLIERLEKEEEDADQLATLFQLDHLATRMRRNNENLMVLSGSETTGRRSGRPVSTADVLRAAVSEIEQYQRVVVQSPPTTKVVGHAASDLMRLMAELLDNATAFSPPETQVTVSTSVGDNGSMTIDILDRGIGMNAAEVDEANERMAEATSLEMVTSRRMGLFVVGRLANRHGISVRLYGGKDIDGVRAAVSVPAELVIGAGGGPLTSEMPAITADGPAPLPRREPGGTIGAAAGSPDALRPASPTAESPAEISGTALFTPIASAESAESPTNGHPVSGPSTPHVNGAKLPQRPVKGDAASRRNGAKTQPAELPAGEALFAAGTTPLSDWWNAAASAEPEPEPEVSRGETTPIFDEMLSVWFRKSSTPETAADKAAGKQGAPGSAWDFAADANWRAVQQVAQKAEPETLTGAGLPRRKRGERLLPGSAIPVPADADLAATPSRSALGRADLPARDPRDVRGRLSSFQRGVKRGRHAATAKPEGEQPTSNGAAAAAKPEAEQPTSNGAAATAPELPKRRSRHSRVNGAVEPTRAAGLPPTGSPELPAQDSDAASHTEAGLPRRRRGEQLPAGSRASAVKPPPAKAPQPDRDPNAMRGRLSSFQQGVRRGRSTAAQSPSATPVSNTARTATSAQATQFSDSKSQENGG